MVEYWHILSGYISERKTVLRWLIFESIFPYQGYMPVNNCRKLRKQGTVDANRSRIDPQNQKMHQQAGGIDSNFALQKGFSA